MGMVKFLCTKHPSLKIVVVPARTIIADSGAVINKQGRMVQFERGEYQTDDQETIDRICSSHFAPHIVMITEEEEKKIAKKVAIEKEVRKEVSDRLQLEGIDEGSELPAASTAKPRKRR